MNDLWSVIRHCQILMYAKETVVFYPGRTASIIMNKPTEDLDDIGSWLCTLFLIVTKTENITTLSGMDAMFVTAPI